MKINSGSAIADTLVRLSTWFCSFWTAATISFASLLAGYMVANGKLDFSELDIITARPDIVTFAWALPGVLSWAGLIIAVLRQRVFLWTWCGTTTVVSVLMLAPLFDELARSRWSVAVASMTWLATTAGVVTALWFLYNWQRNRRAGALAMSQAGNYTR